MVGPSLRHTVGRKHWGLEKEGRRVTIPIANDLQPQTELLENRRQTQNGEKTSTDRDLQQVPAETTVVPTPQTSCS